MLADDKHGIDGKVVAAAAQRLGDTRINLETELLGPLPAQVAFGVLIDVHRHHVEPRLVPFPLVRIANEEPIAHMLAVALQAEFGGDDGHLFSFRRRLRLGRCQ